MRKCSFPECDNEGKIFILDADPPGYYCQNHAELCEDCGYYARYLKTIYGHQNGGKHVCENCYPKYVCPNCERFYDDWNPPIDTDSVKGCGACIINCATCQKPTYRHLAKEADKALQCPTCYETYFTKCDDCGEITDNSKINEVSTEQTHRHRTRVDKNICNTCFEDHWLHCDWCGNYQNKKENEEFNSDPDLCSRCWENSGTCGDCNTVESYENGHTDSNGEFICSSCFERNYSYCQDCSELTKNENIREINDDSLCQWCAEQRGYKDIEAVKEYQDKFNSFTFNLQQRNLNQLRKLVPISIKQLKQKHPALFDSLKEFIKFSQGKDITEELIQEYEQTLDNINIPIEFTQYKNSLQRSVKSSEGQLVLQAIAPAGMIKYMQDNNLYDLFENINETSKESGHPFAENQLGWARLELNPEDHYILVDEIQCDHQNAIDRINQEEHQGKKYSEYIKEKYNLTDEQWIEMVNKFKQVISVFPDVIMNAISEFARSSNYRTIYYHTYESGMKLKGNNPPKSLYTQVPKRHWFKATDNQPFDLNGKFLAREARLMILNRMISKIK